MLIIKQYGKHQAIFHLRKDEHITIAIDDGYIIFRFYENLQYEISDNLEVIESFKNHYVISLKKEFYPCDFYISYFDDNYHIFNKYEVNKRYITIGNNIDNDIYIQDDNLKSNHLTVDLKNKSYINENYPVAFCNHKLKYKNRIEKSIELLNMRLIINDDFIMVNNCLNIYVNLPYFNKHSSKYVTENKIFYINKRFRNNQIFNFKVYDLKKFPLINEINSNPLIFAMGPALTMSLASLTTGLISMYNAYMQGREIIEVMPMLILPAVMMISTLIWNPLQRNFEKKKNQKIKKLIFKDYQLYLEKLKDEILSEFENYKSFLKENYYLADELLDNRLFWQKTVHDSDFLQFSLGIGNKKSNLLFKNTETDDEIKYKIEKFKKEVAFIKEVTIIFDLKIFKHLCIIIKPYDEELYFYYLLFQFLVYYAYDEIKIAIICDESYLNENWFLKGLKHLDADFSQNRYLACNPTEIIKLNKMIKENTVCFVFNEVLLKYLDTKNIYTIILSKDENNIPSMVNAYVLMDGYQGVLYLKNDVPQKFRIDSLSSLNKLAIADKINKSFLKSEQNKINYDLLTLFDIYDIDIEVIKNNWHKNKDTKTLKAVIGKDEHGDDIFLDLHELSHGPHGIVAGMTGSGKSEFIITLIITLALNYSTKDLNIVIIDFKGGAIIQNFKNNCYVLPHIVGTISNLDEGLLRKSITSLRIECLKRQKLFKKMSLLFGVANMNIDTYKMLYEDGLEIENLSHLLIIVDEFAELKKQQPDFMDDLISIARIGRSLGIHLLLSTQKPSGVIDDQIWSNTHFKICLKVQDKQDSYEMIKCNEAANLKKLGMFYMLCDDVLNLAQCAYSNAYIEQIDNRVQILDHLKDIVKESKHKSINHETQLSKAVKNINLINDYCPENLWMKELEYIDIEKLCLDKIYLGLADDYYNKRYLPVTLTDENIVIYSLETNEKIKFIKTYLYNLLKVTKKHEIYIIDGLKSNLKIFYRFYNVVDVLEMADEEKINNLFKRCISVLNKTITINKITVVITNFPLFKEVYEALVPKLRQLIQDGNDYGINFIILTTTFNSLHFQEHVLLINKICLYNLNPNDISAIFDGNYKYKVNKYGYGLIKRDNLLYFRFNEISDEKIMELKSLDNKIYKLPYIDKNLKINDYDGPFFPIGKDMDTYEWIIVDEKGIILCGMFIELINKLQQLLNLPNVEAINYGDFNQIFKKTLTKPVLWIGPGYLRQYHIPIKINEELNENEGIYYYQGKVRRVYLVK